ncbi:uncharacterized protein simc1 isoform X2 [Centropristis striata]|uniref:uncharacterized protein simc1 isoform X2 n=1 Tax=Centropristis striata TaxID=184440 RepID=UPI0027DEF0B2|nr:uncharacterized protein simc1 isoform X2 [Centropristis striata]
MDDVITLSSDSDKDDSDVEIIGSYTNGLSRAEPLPLSAVRIDVDSISVNVPTLFIDLRDPKWTLQELKFRKRHRTSSLTVVDLTEPNAEDETREETENLPPEDSQIKSDSTNKTQTSNKQGVNLEDNSSRPSTVVSLKQDCGNSKPKQRRWDCQTRQQKLLDKAHNHTAIVKLRRLPFLETHITELKTSKCSADIKKDCMRMSLDLSQLDKNGEATEYNGNLRRTAASNGTNMAPSLDESPPTVVESLIRQEEQEKSSGCTSTPLNANISQNLQSLADSPSSDKRGSVANSKSTKSKCSTGEDERDDPPMVIPPSTSRSSSHDKTQGTLQREVICSKLEQLELDKAESRGLSDHSIPYSPTTKQCPSEPFDLNSVSHTSPKSDNLMTQVVPTPTSELTQVENTSEVVGADEASNGSDFLCFSIPSEHSLSAEDMDDGSGAGTHRGDLGIDSPVSFHWAEESSGDEDNRENRLDTDFRAASREDRQFVCPVTLRKIMSGPAQVLFDEEDEGFGTPEVLCRQSLSLVYSTIDENYPEGTLQLLSDLLQPGYFPPSDIISHLLRGILLDTQCPYHLCVQAFNLLMRTQRHHMADTTTIPWDWELLTSVTDNQKHRCEVVRMFLDYVVQTLEDDFQANRSISALHQSIAKATLSCDQQFPHVRDVIKWLFSSIMKSTEHGTSRIAARERDEHVRMVAIFQRMLSLALEVDRSPALTSAKLSQELFHMLISNVPLRAHRMLLLESLQSKLLRCKLLEHLLDYACPLKIPLPMSLSLLLHYLKHCALTPDPSDGTEKWQRWEELVHLLWMLLLSYNKAMKGYLCNSVSEQNGIVGNLVYKPDDKVSKPAIREAVEAFMSRSQADLGQALPLHVEESLTYLQDHLLEVCQC